MREERSGRGTPEGYHDFMRQFLRGVVVRRGLAWAAVVWSVATTGCGRTSESVKAIDQSSGPTASISAIDPHSLAEITAFCGDCHKLPLSTSFPRSRWPKEVRQGYEFYLESGRADLRRPVELDAIRYFSEAAPEKLPIEPVSRRQELPTTVRFERMPLAAGVFDAIDPAIAHILWREEHGDFLASDMRSGSIYRFDLRPASAASEVLTTLNNPCRIVSWPGAHATFVVGDLGSFMPADHDRGSVRLLGDFQAGSDASILATGFSRVVEAQPFDSDGDGDLDVVVAEFGWRQTGALRLLVAEADGSYRDTVLDPRHGAVAVRIADLDADGHDDIIAAFGQEHETVDVYWGDGSGSFTHEIIHAFPDPSWGTSGFELVDIDHDGLLDILHANGDTLDSGLAKPYHGIRVIRNHGSRRFKATEVGAMVGACQASAADLDGDGDLDIVACSLFQNASSEPPGTFDAITWFEQLPDGSFTPHGIARDSCEHVAFALADVDDDGRIDVVAGVWQGQEMGEPRPSVVVYRNLAHVP